MTKSFLSASDARKEWKLFARRMTAIVVVLGILVILMVVRLIKLQIFQHQLYTTLSQQNQVTLLPIDPNRGLIYDRRGVLLAEDVPIFDLVVMPDKVHNFAATLRELQAIIPISNDDLQQYNRQLRLHRRFEPVPLRTRLTPEEVARFSLEQYRFPGVAIRPIIIRHYPLGATFAPVVGSVGRIDVSDLAKVDDANYSATNFIGKVGVEKYYENILHGKVGYKQQETDAMGHAVRILRRIPPVPGDNLYLTIDSQLQLAAEQILSNYSGAVVAINPQNGEVLALVSNPSFDPNLFVTGISKKDYEILRDAPGQPLYNRALHGQYPPGSTVKPLIALGALSAGLVTPEFTIFCPGFYRLRNSSHIYHDWRHQGHGVVSVIKAIEQSCDIYFYTLANKIGIETIAETLQKFGYGQHTGIDLDSEAIGVVPSPAWKRKKYNQQWYPGDTLITGIGQGFNLVTPLQLAVAATILATKGHAWVPHVLLRREPVNGPVRLTTPVPRKPVEFTDSAWQLVHEAMQGVAKTPGGTAYSFFLKTPYTLAAKTGTAQVFSLKGGQRDVATQLPTSLRDNSMFIAFAPVEAPRIAIAVVVQNTPIHAAQLARQILDAYLIDKTATPPATGK